MFRLYFNTIKYIEYRFYYIYYLQVFKENYYSFRKDYLYCKKLNNSTN